MDLVYGIPALAILVMAFVYVRRVAWRARKGRARRTRKPPKYMRSISQRSEMRAGEDPTTVMEDIQRTQSRPRLDDGDLGRAARKGDG